MSIDATAKNGSTRKTCKLRLGWELLGAFEDAEVTLEVLPELTEADLRELGLPLVCSLDGRARA